MRRLGRTLQVRHESQCPRAGEGRHDDMRRVHRQRDARGEKRDGAGLVMRVGPGGRGVLVAVLVRAGVVRRMQLGVEVAVRPDEAERQHERAGERGEQAVGEGRRATQDGARGTKGGAASSLGGGRAGDRGVQAAGKGVGEG